VDSRLAALAEAGDILIAMEEGAMSRDIRLTELSEVVTGQAMPRTGTTDITLFESLGLAVEDVAAARMVYERALAAGIATIAFG
jgi:alanine dehydrogenase